MHDAVSLVGWFSTLKRCSVTAHSWTVGSSDVSIIKLGKYWISWCLPINIQLLAVNHLISLDNLLYYSFRFLFIHLPDFADSVIVTLLESLVFLLKFLKHLSEVLKFFSTFNVLSLEFSEFLLVLSFNFSHYVLETSLSQAQELGCFLINGGSFSKHFCIEV